MKKSIILSVLFFFFLSVSTSFAQTKWADFVAKIPELSLPYEFNFEKNIKEGFKISDKDLKTHFKFKIDAGDMWFCKTIGKITAPNGSIAIIYSKSDNVMGKGSYAIAFFSNKGKYKETEQIMYTDGENIRKVFTIKMEADEYVFEEVERDYSNNIIHQKLTLRKKIVNW